MSDLSKKARTLIDDVTSETTSAWDEYGLSPAEYDLWQAVDPMRSTGSHKPHGNGSSLLASLCDEIEALEKENAEMRSQLCDVEFSLGQLLSAEEMARAEAEHERDSLRAEIETLRRGPTTVLGMTLSEIAEMRDRLDAADPSHSDSALYRAMADDPKSYPPEKP